MGTSHWFLDQNNFFISYLHFTPRGTITNLPLLNTQNRSTQIYIVQYTTLYSEHMKWLKNIKLLQTLITQLDKQSWYRLSLLNEKRWKTIPFKERSRLILIGERWLTVPLIKEDKCLKEFPLRNKKCWNQKRY